MNAIDYIANFLWDNLFWSRIVIVVAIIVNAVYVFIRWKKHPELYTKPTGAGQLTGVYPATKQERRKLIILTASLVLLVVVVLFAFGVAF